MKEEIVQQTRIIAEEFLEKSKLKSNQLLVVGCSTSEILGEKIGSHSSQEIGKIIFDCIYQITQANGIFLAAQCCEHLNRALILESTVAEIYRLDPVNVVPFPKAGGSFAAAAYQTFLQPVAVEAIKADAGIDIGDTLIGMHLKSVAVPVRLSVSHIGDARVVCAKTRPKYIGGERAHYNISLS